MIDPIQAAMSIASSGLSANSTRLKITAEHIANAQSTASVPGADPYRRKTITFENALDEVSGADVVKVGNIGADQSAFTTQFDPGNPGADGKGFVKLPNVNLLLEMADMREANRSYEANLQVIKESRSLATMTIDLLKG
jgi:flagellar basal-body rod protein FlgC